MTKGYAILPDLFMYDVELKFGDSHIVKMKVQSWDMEMVRNPDDEPGGLIAKITILGNIER